MGYFCKIIRWIKKMVLKINESEEGLFTNKGLFKNSPQDGEANLWFGRFIPTGQLSSELKSAGTTANDTSIGSKNWANTDNAKTSDEVWSSWAAENSAVNVTDHSVKLIDSAGTIGGDNKNNGKVIINGPDENDETKIYGSQSDLWGLTWKASDINDVDFGVVYAEKGSALISNYLKLTNFGFAIPTQATIVGIEVSVEGHTLPGTPTVGKVDHIEIRVYYYP